MKKQEENIIIGRHSHLSKRKICGIYRITSPTGRIYVGSSKNIYKRWKSYYRLSCKEQPKLYHSLNKHNPTNHIFDILEECVPGLLSDREIYWGLHYDVLSRVNLNGHLGRFKKIISDETINKRVGTTVSFDITKHFSKLYEHHDQVVELYKNKTTSYIASILNCNVGTVINYLKRCKLYIPNKNKIITRSDKAKSSQKSTLNKSNKPLIQCDLFGNFIREWSSISEAKKFHKGDIQAAVAGNQRHANGFLWKAKSENIVKERNVKRIKKQPVIQFNMNNQLIKEFESISDAERNYPSNGISRCCRGLQKSASGYIWKYKI